jgi:tryptophanase
MTNIGGMLCTNSDELNERLRDLTIVIEGFVTYGGLACRELEAMARGLQETVDDEYQA